MKKAIFLIILSFSILFSVSQEIDYVLPDSLQMLLRENNKADARRMDALQTVIDALHEQQQYQ